MAAWRRALARVGLLPMTDPPDLDNIFKALKDGMNKIVYTDDRRVDFIAGKKTYARDDEPAQVAVTVWALAEPLQPPRRNR